MGITLGLALTFGYIAGRHLASSHPAGKHSEEHAPMTSRDLPPLTLTEPEMRAIAAQVSSMIVDHFVQLPNLPVTRPSDLAALKAGLAEPLPLVPTPMPELLAQMDRLVIREMTHNDHPRNFAFVPGPSNFISVMADALASAFNVFCGGWIGPSGSAQLELVTLDWLRQLLDLPDTAGGLFVSGGSMANLTRPIRRWQKV
jgi:aromatic-L-amino-acid/L-tryptophan decarboxylase